MKFFYPSLSLLVVFFGFSCNQSTLPAQPTPRLDEEAYANLPKYPTITRLGESLSCDTSAESFYPCIRAYAESNGYDDELFVIHSMSEGAVEDPKYITQQKAIDAVTHSDIAVALQYATNDVWQQSDLYTTREVLALDRQQPWFVMDKTAQTLFNQHASIPVWQVLIHCSGWCDSEQFQNEMEKYLPGRVHGNDLIFVIDANTGHVLFYATGLGTRGDHINFVTYWASANM